MSDLVWAALIAAVPPTLVALRVKRSVDQVHTLVNSQKTLLEQQNARLEKQLAVALEELRVLKLRFLG